MKRQEHISVDPLVCHGRACVRGTRVMVSVILDSLAEGVPRAEILASYPQLVDDDIQACIAYAAELARERVVPIRPVAEQMQTDSHVAGGESTPRHGPTDLLMARIRAAQQLTPEQRVLAGIEQSELAMSVVRDGIQDQHPEADAATVERLLCERVELMRRLQRRSVAGQSGVAQ